MSAWGFDGAHGTDVRPPHVDATKGWAKDESAPGVNDGTRLTASVVNRLVGNIRRAATLFGFTVTQTSDDDLAGIIAAGVAASPPQTHTHDDRYYTKGETEPTTSKNQPNGYAGLDSGGKVLAANLPAIAITDTFEAESQAAMLALTAEVGDVCIRSDVNKSFILAASPATTLANWKELSVPTGAVLSVAGRSGAVVLTKADSGLAKLWTRGADVASASTVNLTSATGDYLTVTGTTAITAITLTDGEQSVVRFAAALTLTNGASLILPTGANIVTAAGDIAVFRGEASGVVRCIDYVRANGRALAHPIADQATAESGANNTDLMTPLRSKQLIDALGLMSVLGTAVTASGTAIDFTGIPAAARRITISFADLSTNGVSHPILQIGDSGGIEATGYLGACSAVSGSPSSANFTTGFGLFGGLAAYVMHGSIVLTKISGNTWAASIGYAYSNVAATGAGGGSKTLSATLDRIRLTTVNGTDTFDAGTVNILVE